MPTPDKTTGVTPLDNFHSDELRAELARREAITEEAVQLYKSLTQTTMTDADRAEMERATQVAWAKADQVTKWRMKRFGYRPIEQHPALAARAVKELPHD